MVQSTLPELAYKTAGMRRGLLLCFFLVAASCVSLRGQQTKSAVTVNAVTSHVQNVQKDTPDDPDAEEGAEHEANPAVVLQPNWLFSTDSDANVRNRLKLESSIAAGSHNRIGLLVGESLIFNSMSGSNTEDIRDTGLTGQWRRSNVLKFDGMAGVSITKATTNADGQRVEQASIPITNVHVDFTPADERLKLDLGFERFIYDLSPQLVSNRVVRNQFVIHPELELTNGWRVRALAEMGPMTRPGESNARYNSEFTIGHKVGKQSELYSTYGLLHYAGASDAGYFSPDLVHNLQAGWTGDIDRGSLSLSLDLALGADRAKEHGTGFGAWGVSGGAGSYLTWTIAEKGELSASYEYYYDQSSPAVEPTPSGAWHMSIVTISFHWAINGRHGPRSAQPREAGSKR